MKRIAVTQRVAIDPSNGERRDALDQRWFPLLEACGLLPVIVPNHLPTARKLFENERLAGILLTGGNDVASVGGDVPDRDRVEHYLIERAMKDGFPLLGVCRGMQTALEYFGAKLVPTPGHVGAHEIRLVAGGRRQVNSFHRYGALDAASGIRILATAPDGVIERFEHEKYPIFGIMWHPERDATWADEDLKLFRSTF